MNDKTHFTVDPDGKWLYRVGGIAAIAFGITYLVIIVLYVPVGLPTGAEDWLKSLAEHTTRWSAIIALDVLTDFLLVPFALSLYLALKGINKSVMLTATAFTGLFIILDLPLTWMNIASLHGLSSQYAAATNDAQREVIVTAAMVPSSIVESNLLGVYNSLTLAIGILMTSLVMLKGIFNKATAYVGVATGILGIVAVTSSFFASTVSTVSIILAALLTMVWALFAGFRLYKLSQQMN
jgi:hypothetical protein